MILADTQDWIELSRLYDHAEDLDEVSREQWLAALEAEENKLVAQLRQMLSAGDAMRGNPFLDGQPRLASQPYRSQWSPGSRIGPYRLERVIGEGGMSDVWLAQRADGAFERSVAIKLLADHPIREQRSLFAERFQREKDILATLDHPHIATLHDAGLTPEGYPWLALEYIDGREITLWCDGEHTTIEARVRLFLQVLEAVEHAHGALVIHRDIKPSNMLVGMDGSVKLLDFGIAKLVEASGPDAGDTALTREGGRLMTPQYASPEQVCGETLTTATDIYSLGVLLYELLTGDLPYRLAGKPPHAIEAIFADETPRFPSRAAVSPQALANRALSSAQELSERLRPDLDAIVAKALERHAGRRYRSATELRADLQRWLAFEPVLATAPSFAYRAGKFLRRNRRAIVPAGAAAFALVVASALAYYKEVRAEREALAALASKQFLLDMFRATDPSVTKAVDASAGQLLDASAERALRTLAGQPDLQADVLKNIAEIDARLDRYVPAQAVLEKLVQVHERLGHAKPEIAARIDLAENEFRIGNYAQAQSELYRVGVRLQRTGDVGLESRFHLISGWVALYEGRNVEAKDQLGTALRQSRQAFGEFDTRTAWAYRVLSEAEVASRDFDAGRQHILDASRSVAKAPDSSNVDVIGIEIERARAESTAGLYATAIPLAATAADHCDTTFGSANESCFLVRILEYQLYIKTGDVHKALELLPALQLEAKNGLSPRRQVEAQFGVVRVLAANGMWHDAEAASDHLRTMLEEGSTLPGYVILSGYQAIAEAQIREGRGGDALATLATAAAKGRDRPAGAMFGARSVMFRAIALAIDGELDLALDTIHVAEAAYGDAFGETHTQTLLCSLNEVTMLVDKRDYLTARQRLLQITKALEGKLPDQVPLTKQVAALSRALSDDLHRDLSQPPYFY